ncbi:hypothetical protein GCM10009815_35060 [Nocardioides marmoribigeumensis]
MSALFGPLDGSRFRLRDMRTTGSRTAAYLVVGLVVSLPVWFLATLILGLPGGWAVLVVGWATGLVWLAKKRQDDPGWDARLP